MPTEHRRVKISLGPALTRSLKILGLSPDIDPADGVPADGAIQITAALVRYADAIDRAGRELNQLLDREEWNLMADVLNGCADLWEYSESPPMYSLSLIRAEVEDGHRLDGLGYKWFGEEDRKKADAKLKALLGKLGKLNSLQGDAIMAAVRHFWRHAGDGIDHTEIAWWMPEYRVGTADRPKARASRAE
jgi:hypothetical protein